MRSGLTPPIIKNNQIKYNLIYRLRKKGFSIDTRQRTIYCEYSNIPEGFVQLDRLRKEFDFFIQTEIT